MENCLVYTTSFLRATGFNSVVLFNLDPACTEHLLGGWHCDGLKNECNVVPPLKCFSLWEEAEMSSMSLLICPNVLVYGQGVQIEENWLYLPRGSRV